MQYFKLNHDYKGFVAGTIISVASRSRLADMQAGAGELYEPEIGDVIKVLPGHNEPPEAIEIETVSASEPESQNEEETKLTPEEIAAEKKAEKARRRSRQRKNQRARNKAESAK